MKTITIPPPVVIKDLNDEILISNGEPIIVTFKQFIINTLLIDQKFGKGMAEIFTAVEIKSKLKEATNSFVLDNADWEMLKNVASEPTTPYNAAVVIQCFEFLKAIKDAV